MDLALILEFGSRQRLLALGRISALLPSADNDLMRLNMEAIGVIDFDAGTAAIDAELVDSRLAHKFPITGSAALRAGFGEARASSSRSAGSTRTSPRRRRFPALKRVAIALSSGTNPRLICEAYFAITSNTVQFGADASLYASAAGFSVEGDVGFDVLVQLVPLHFLADFHAKLQLKRGSRNLFRVTLNGALEGPRPLRVSGKAKFEILWCDFSVHFDATLVKGERPPLPPAVNVLCAAHSRRCRSRHELEHRAQRHCKRTASRCGACHPQRRRRQSCSTRWAKWSSGSRSCRSTPGATSTLRRRAGARGPPLHAHRGAQRHAAANGPLQADFAPAQFFVMSDDEKLAAPSFRVDGGGLRVRRCRARRSIPRRSFPRRSSTEVRRRSRSTILRPMPQAHRAAPAQYTLSAAQLQAFAVSGAAATGAGSTHRPRAVPQRTVPTPRPSPRRTGRSCRTATARRRPSIPACAPSASTRPSERAQSRRRAVAGRSG